VRLIRAIKVYESIASSTLLCTNYMAVSKQSCSLSALVALARLLGGPFISLAAALRRSCSKDNSPQFDFSLFTVAITSSSPSNSWPSTWVYTREPAGEVRYSSLVPQCRWAPPCQHATSYQHMDTGKAQSPDADHSSSGSSNGLRSDVLLEQKELKKVAISTALPLEAASLASRFRL